MGWREKIVRGHHKSVADLASPRIIQRLMALIVRSLAGPLSPEEIREVGELRAEHDKRGLTDHVGPGEWRWAYSFPDSAGLWQAALTAAQGREAGTAAAMRAAAVTVCTDRIIDPDGARIIAESMS